MPPRVVYIASLPHSGSTLLSLLLGGHDRITSFGEAVRTIELIQEGTEYASGPSDFEDRFCTCGREATNCPIWGEVHGSFLSGEWSTTIEGYECLLEEAESHSDSSQIIVDSSKVIDTFETLSEGIGGNVAPLFLVRDIRGWMSSMKKNWSEDVSGKFGDMALYNYILQYLIHTTPGLVARWYKRNTEMKESLVHHEYFQVGYEELCLQSKQILGLITDWLDIGFDEGMTDPTAANSHLVRGNSMKNNENKLGGIYYDNRWFYSRRQQALGWLLLPVFTWNMENVYPNLKGRKAGTSIHVTGGEDKS